MKLSRKFVNDYTNLDKVDFTEYANVDSIMDKIGLRDD